MHIKGFMWPPRILAYSLKTVGSTATSRLGILLAKYILFIEFHGFASHPTDSNFDAFYHQDSSHHGTSNIRKSYFPSEDPQI